MRQQFLKIAACLVLGFFGLAACTDRRSAAPSVAAATKSTADSSPAAAAVDADADGFPDAIELRGATDRENFRRWFTAIADRQYDEMSEAWNGEQRDCAGLVRFALREALRRHDRLWFQKMGAGYESVAPDVRALKLGENLLGEKLFRTDYGSFTTDDVAAGKFSEYADARTLKNYNVEFVSRDRRRAEIGDLLFFTQPWAQKYPFHVMIYLGRVRGEQSEADAGEAIADWVVYHTGASPADAGQMKRVRLSVLDRHPDRRWRPVEGNSKFLGFYRLKLLQ